MILNTPWIQFARFLSVGTEGTLTYAGRTVFEPEDVTRTAAAIREDGVRAVEWIASAQHRAARNYALALAASLGDGTTRRAALDLLPTVAATSMDLFAFCEGCRGLRGWGRGLRSSVARWYLSRPIELLAQELVNCPEALGWSHRDLLRLAHPVAEDAERDALFRWAVSGEGEPPVPKTGPCPLPPVALPKLGGRVAICIDGSASMASSRVPGHTSQTTWEAAREVVDSLLGAEVYGYSDHLFEWPGFDAMPTPTGALSDPSVVAGIEGVDSLVILTNASVWAARQTPAELAAGRKFVVVTLGSDRPLFGEQADANVLHVVGYGPDVSGMIASFLA